MRIDLGKLAAALAMSTVAVAPGNAQTNNHLESFVSHVRHDLGTERPKAGSREHYQMLFKEFYSKADIEALARQFEQMGYRVDITDGTGIWNFKVYHDPESK